MAWVLVYTTNSEADAHMIEGLLQSNDIPAQVLSQVDSTRGLTIGGLAVAKVYVPVADYEQARECLQSLTENDTDDEN